MRVLVVDSDRSARGTTLDVLREEGIEAIPAESVKGAIRAIERNPDIQIVILDLELQYGNPLDILLYLKTSLRYRHIASIVYTASADATSIRQSVELGARDYILKPFTRETLISRVQKALAYSIGAVLVVDDDEVVVDLLARIVKREGYDVFTAYSGDEALKIASTERIFAVISDIVMPGLSGFDLLVKLKELYPDLFVIMITGQSEKHGRENVIAAGADGYLTKPFKNVEIARKLNAFGRILRQYRERLQARA